MSGINNTDSGCQYCIRAEEAYIVPNQPHEPKIGITVWLCSWADTSPESVTKLLDVPVWLSREALGGHLMRNGDCAKCAAFKKREA